MRITQKRKRSGYTPYRSTKRRYTKKRWSKRNSSITTKSGVGNSFGFRAKKLSRRKWNNKLWNDTLALTKYRSNGVRTLTIGTPSVAGVGIYTVSVNAALPDFWTVGNGALPSDVGGTVPAFTDDIVIRGGIIGCRVCNDVSDTQPITAIVYLIRTGDAFINNIPANVNEGWDPTLVPDFSTNIGRVVMKKQFMLENGNSADVKFRVPIKKIEQVPFIAVKNNYVWVILANNNQGIASSMTSCFYWNLTFTGAPR